MPNFIYNRALGRVAEWHNNIFSNTPPNSAFVVEILATTGVETDAVLRDKDDLLALVSGTTNFVTNSGYARKTLTEADILAYGPDDTADDVKLDLNDITWVTIGAGDGWSDLVLSYDADTTAGTDANVIPATHHDFVVTPDGSNITAQIAAAGYFRAVSS